jgi:glycosidase
MRPEERPDALTITRTSNAMVINFMTDGIPIVYYGQEHGFSGNADPVRQASMT